MSVRYFLDTNIFVYSFDIDAPLKRHKSLELIDKALQDGSGLISTQVVQEFLNVASGKFSQSLTLTESKAYLKNVLAPLCEVYPDVDYYGAALDIQTTTGYSFYDALIIAAAKKAGCAIIYTEDLQDGQKIDRLLIKNPFSG